MLCQVDLTHYLNDLLEVNRVNDYCPNGLQVQGRDEIKTIVSGVTASAALIERAVDLQADAILVHHGYFWKGEAAPITGVKYKRLRALLRNDINLYAYHLPLDIHPIYGNNVQLAKLFDMELVDTLEVDGIDNLFFVGKPTQPMGLKDFSKLVAGRLHRQPTTVAAGNHEINTIAWCSGGAQRYIEKAADVGVDAYLSGEISEQTAHIAKESATHYIAAGHHATERYGVKALGEHLTEKFNINHHFIDIFNPA